MGKEYQVRNGVLVDKTPRVAAIVGRNVGELVHSIVPLVDANLHLLDGTQLQDDGIYADGIAKIKALQSRYPGLFTTEADWQASVTQYGVCGKFVIGTGTLRLPKLAKSFIEATIDATALGDLVEAGLPNITGSTRSLFASISAVGPTGVFTDGSTRTTAVAGSANQTFTVHNFDASLSNSIYGNSTTVQPQSIKGFIYIVMGTFPKSSAVVNLDNVATDLNSKTTAEQAAHAAMPKVSVYVDVESPTATGYEYTAPADGYFRFSGVAAVNGNYNVRFKTPECLVYAASNGSTTQQSLTCLIPVSIGDVLILRYSNVSTWTNRFIYANGNAHLAS